MPSRPACSTDQTLLEVCTGEAICAGISGRLIGRQSEQELEVGNKRLGYLRKVIQCRACWNRRKLGTLPVSHISKYIPTHLVEQGSVVQRLWGRRSRGATRVRCGIVGWPKAVLAVV